MLKTQQRIKWCGEGETEPMENVCWPLWKNGKNDCYFAKTHCTTKFPIINLPKFGSPLFLMSMETENGHWPLWKKWLSFCKNSSYRKISNYQPPRKFGSLLSLVMMETENSHQPSWKKNGKVAAISQKLVIQQNFHYQSPKSLGLRFFSVYSTSHLCVALHFLILFIVFSHRPGIIYSRLC